jgi:hypothetical protein
VSKMLSRYNLSPDLPTAVEGEVRSILKKHAPSLYRRYWRDEHVAWFGIANDFFWLPVVQGKHWCEAVGIRYPLELAAVAQALASAHYLIQDRLIDSQLPVTVEMLLMSEAYLRLGTHYLNNFATAVGLAEGFAERLAIEHQDRYSSSILAEMDRSVGKTLFGVEDILSLGDKSAPANTAFEIPYLAAFGAASKLTTLRESTRSLGVGLQLVDDLLDADEDQANGVWTWPLSLVFAGARDHGEESPASSVLLFGTNAGCHVVDIAQRAFVQSCELADSIEATVLSTFARDMVARVESLRNRTG